jgi:hypothetical protein
MDFFMLTFRNVATLVAAAWAIYGLFAFRQREIANTVLRKNQLELARAELAAKRGAVLDIVIKCETHAMANSYVLMIQVDISNKGMNQVYMNFEKVADSDKVAYSPLCIQRVDFKGTGQMVPLGSPIFIDIPRASDFKKPIRGRLIRADGGTSRLNTVVQLLSPGVYAVGFRVLMDEYNQSLMRDAGAASSRIQHWSATTFTLIS